MAQDPSEQSYTPSAENTLRPLPDSRFYDCLYTLTSDGSRIAPEAIGGFLELTRNVFGEQSNAFTYVLNKASTGGDYDVTFTVLSRLFGNIERNFGNLPSEIMDTIYTACRGFVLRGDFKKYIPITHSSPMSEFSRDITTISLMLKGIGIIAARPDIEALVIKSANIIPDGIQTKGFEFYGLLLA